MLTLLAKPLFIVLNWVHSLFGNWGWTIIFVTFLLKLAFYPLSETSGRSMAKMKLLGPRMKELQETYKDDREKLGRAMMELYKQREGEPGRRLRADDHPDPGVLRVLLGAARERRDAPGAVHRLAHRPVVEGSVLHPAGHHGGRDVHAVQAAGHAVGMDPVQQKVFMIMPFAMSVMFAFFPSGLVLYWVTNTVLSIAQQWNINRRIEKEKAKTARASAYA